MDFWQVIRARHSVREYDPNVEVSPEHVEQILEAAIRAPSAGNCQPWRFLVIRDKATRQRLVDAAYGQGFLAQAPVVIAVCAEPGRSAAPYGKRGAGLYCVQDTAAATEHILLAATALGFGTCWVGAFDDASVAQVLALPEELRPVALIPIGRSAEPASLRASRRPLGEVSAHGGSSSRGPCR